MSIQHGLIAISSQNLSGKRLGTNIQLLDKVGQGGMAWVFQAWDDLKQQAVAVKILLPHMAEDPKIVARFLKEAKLQHSLQHENIVANYGGFQSNNLNYIVLEWVQGESLRELMKRVPPPYSLPDIWMLMEPILKGVGHAHQKGMVHRDLKPGNFLLSWEKESLQLKVSDFGLAKILNQQDLTSQTSTNAVMGTIKYMSPEQVKNSKYVNHHADIYSLGVCLYQMAVGDVPFHGTAESVMVNIILNEPPQPRSVNPLISESFEKIILKSMAKNQNERYANCEEFAKALESLVLNEDTTNSSRVTPIPYERSLTQNDVQAWIANYNRKQATSPIDDKSFLHHVKPSPPKYKMIGLWLLPILLGLVAWGLFARMKMNSNSHPINKDFASCNNGDTRTCYPKTFKSFEGVGECKSGRQLCKDNQWSSCEGYKLPDAKDLCNGKDDNCDGKVDELFKNKGKPCSLKKDACEFQGTWVCNPHNRKRTTCEPDKKQKTHSIHFSFQLPKKVRLRIDGSRSNTVKSRYCVSLPTSGKKKRISIRARGFYPCQFVLHPNNVLTGPMTIKLKKSRGFEPPLSYCRANK